MIDTISISGACEATGFSERQLRSYEKRGYIKQPIRITSGALKYRRYSAEHIRSIKLFKKYLDQGYTLPTASRKAFEDLGKEES